MVDLGYFSMCLALVCAGYAASACVVGARRQNHSLILSGEHAALAYCGLLTVSVIALWGALFAHDFQVQYVAENSLDSVYFSGFQSRSHVLDFYRIADVLVLPSWRDDRPRVSCRSPDRGR